MKYYEKYKDALEKYGYTVDAEGSVRDGMGNQAAAEDRFGNVHCSDPNVIDICRDASVENTPPKRARNEKGHLMADDPSTPENEAWEGGVAPKKKKAKKS
jgi:hypothetical protein